MFGSGCGGGGGCGLCVLCVGAPGAGETFGWIGKRALGWGGQRTEVEMGVMCAMSRYVVMGWIWIGHLMLVVVGLLIWEPCLHHG